MEWEIDDTGAYRSELVLTMEVDENDPQKDAKIEILRAGYNKFKNHVDKCIDRIETGFEEYFSDENVAERLRSNETEFTSTGNPVEVSIG